MSSELSEVNASAPEGKKREEWSSRWAFYFAAVGAAVGFGNVWRFPALSVEYGGGAFFIPYILALFFVGYPILVLEVGLGQFFQTGHINAFGNMNIRFRGVGVAAVMCGFMLTVFYSMLIAWVLNAFFDSFGSDDPWDKVDVSGEEAVGYFVGEIIGAKTLGEDGTPTRLVWANVGYSFLTWAIIFFGTAWGVEWTGRITFLTMGLPIVFLFIFLIRALTLDGSDLGVKEYIGRWDMSVLTEQADVWTTAVSQIFFSLGVTFGIMTAFGSYCPKREPVVLNSGVIALSNSTFSVISGFAVFAALGHLSYKTGVPVTDLPYGGFSLVFGTWPVVLSTLPGGEHWVRLLFFNLFLLGIDSAFALIEAATTVLLDSKTFNSTPKWKVTFCICFASWLLSFLYATDAGLNFLDVVDFYINYVMILIGFFECFAVGWSYGLYETVQTCGLGATISYLIANFGSVLLASSLWFGVSKEDGGVWAGFVALIGMYLFFAGITFMFLKEEAKKGQNTLSELVYAVTFKNIFDLKARIEPGTKYIPGIWAILIKQFIPHLLIILFINLATTETATGENTFGHYGGYDMRPYQVMGILVFVFTLFLFSVGFIYPPVYESFIDESNYIDAEEFEKPDATNTSRASKTGGVLSMDGEGSDEVDVEDIVEDVQV